MFNLSIPTTVFCGKDSMGKLPETIAQYGRNILFVFPSELEKHMAYVANILQDFFIHYLAIESTEPTCLVIDEQTRILKESGVTIDCILGLGGGSAIDFAKSLSISLTHAESIWLYANLSNRPPLPLENSLIPVIALPTTSGTGADVTPYAVLTNSETKQKGTIQEPAIFPKYAFIDPKLLISMPPAITASTGIDALAHALESFINISKVSPVSEWAASEAIKLVFDNLPIAFNSPNDSDARCKMAWASTLAGIAISHRGTTTTHAIAEPLGALTKLPHGLAVAICTLPVLRASMPVIEDKLAELYVRIFINEPLVKDNLGLAFIEKLEGLLTSVGLNTQVQNYLKNIDDTFLSQLIDNILKYKFRPLKQHPVEFSKSDLEKIVNEILFTQTINETA